MDLTTVALAAAWLGVAINLYIVLVCVPDPARGMLRLSHIVEHLPKVMLGRYLAFLGFSTFLAVLGDLKVIAGWIVALAFMAFADTFIYWRQGKPFAPHLAAGAAAIVILAVVVAALNSNGAA